MNFSQMNAGTIGTKLGFAEEPACAKHCPNLTFKQRVMGFGCCFALGWLLSLAGTMTLIGGPTAANINAFVSLYVIGNVVALCSTGFLLGPRSQCRQMFHPTRRYTTALYLSMLLIVLCCAVTKQSLGVVLPLLLLEILVALWYSISYIPFARKMIIAYLRRGPCGPCFQMYDEARASLGLDKKEQGTIGSTLSNVTGGNAKKKGFSFLGGGDDE